MTQKQKQTWYDIAVIALIIASCSLMIGLLSALTHDWLIVKVTISAAVVIGVIALMISFILTKPQD